MVGLHLKKHGGNVEKGLAAIPAGRSNHKSLAALAQMERELLAERTRAGLDAARVRGRVGGRKRRMTPGNVESARKLMSGRWLPEKSLRVSAFRSQRCTAGYPRRVGEPFQPG